MGSEKLVGNVLGRHRRRGPRRPVGQPRRAVLGLLAAAAAAARRARAAATLPRRRADDRAGRPRPSERELGVLRKVLDCDDAIDVTTSSADAEDQQAGAGHPLGGAGQGRAARRRGAVRRRCGVGRARRRQARHAPASAWSAAAPARPSCWRPARSPPTQDPQDLLRAQHRASLVGRPVMTRFGYTLMTEQSGPKELVSLRGGRRAGRLRLRGVQRPLLSLAAGDGPRRRTPGRCSARSPRPPSGWS